MPKKKLTKRVRTSRAATAVEPKAKKARAVTQAAELADDDGKLRIPGSMKAALQARAKEKGFGNWKTFALEELQDASLGRKKPRRGSQIKAS